MKKTSNVIKAKKATLDILEELFETLEREEKYVTTKTVWFDTDQPRLDDDGNPKTRKDGSIVYEQEYKIEDKAEDELTEDDNIKLEAINSIKTALEKLV